MKDLKFYSKMVIKYIDLVFNPFLEVENGLKEITVNGQDVEVIIYKINPTLKTYKASISL